MPVPSYISPQEYTLPDLLALLPFKGSTNPHYSQVAAESAAWVDSYAVFTGRKRELFRMSCIELLAANTYPYAGCAKFRICCDVVNLLTLVDDICDDQTGKEAEQLSQSYLRALSGGSCDGSLISQIAKDFRIRLEGHISPTSDVMRRFLKEATASVNAIAQEAALRECSKKVNASNFAEFRRISSGTLPCFQFIEIALGIELPDEVFEDQTFQKMQTAAIDILCRINDICSYCREASKGIAEMNIITVLMRNDNMSLQEAIDHSGVLVKAQIDLFLEGKASIPSFGVDVDPKVRAYIMGLEQWIVGSTNWSFDAGRYFGQNAEDVKKTRVVKFQQIMYPEGMNQ